MGNDQRRRHLTMQGPLKDPAMERVIQQAMQQPVVPKQVQIPSMQRPLEYARVLVVPLTELKVGDWSGPERNRKLAALALEADPFGGAQLVARYSDGTIDRFFNCPFLVRQLPKEQPKESGPCLKISTDA